MTFACNSGKLLGNGMRIEAERFIQGKHGESFDEFPFRIGALRAQVGVGSGVRPSLSPPRRRR
jgi:hypothetical protein